MDTNEAGWETVRKRPPKPSHGSEQVSLTRTASQASHPQPAARKSRSKPLNPSPSKAPAAGHVYQPRQGRERGGRREPRGSSDAQFRQAAPARKGKQAREDARQALQAEARKSEKDVFTGRRHCLSCGKAFSAIESLAEHLKKHDGVNSDDYKVLHYERQRARGGAAPRPSRTGFTTSDLFEAALAKARLRKESRTDSSKATSRQRRAQNSGTVVASTGLARNVSKAPKVKASSNKQDGLQSIEEDERLRLESAFQGLKLKRTRRLAKRTKRVTAVKKFVMLERVAAAQRLVERATSRVRDFEQQKNLFGDKTLDETESIKQEAEIAALLVALSKAEDGLREAKAQMQKKVTARQHVMNLLYVSLRSDAVNEGLSEMGSIDYDQKAASEVLALFDELDASVSEDEGKDKEEGKEEASDWPATPPNDGCPNEEQSLGEIVQNQKAEEPMTPSNSSISDFEGPPDLLTAWASSAGLNQQFAEFLNMEAPAMNSADSVDSRASQGWNENADGVLRENLADGDDLSGSSSDETSCLADMETNVLADWANTAGSGGIDFQSLLFAQEENSRSPSPPKRVDSGNGSMSAMKTQEKGVTLRVAHQSESPCNQSIVFLEGNVKLDLGGSTSGVDKLGVETNAQDDIRRAASGNAKEDESAGSGVIMPMQPPQPTVNKAKTVRSYAAVLSGKPHKMASLDKEIGTDSAIAEADPDLGENFETKKKKRKKKKKKPVADGSHSQPLEGQESNLARAFACDMCGVACSTSGDLQEHLRGKLHANKAARDAMISMEEHTRESVLMESPIPGTVKAVDDAVVALLTRLNELQHNSLVRHNEERSKAHRWLTNGTKEVTRALTKGKLKAMILASNIENPLDDAISKIVEGVRSQGVFAVYALNRKKLGRIFHFRKKMSVVGILDLNGVQPLFQHLQESVEASPQVRVGIVDL
ncbi:hypothetical protein BSKO_13927 [Bryopsis sp. KO-2023]|nr:hypothetical protein BSKO_13927 [Bryopsis sp. KO-2023]